MLSRGKASPIVAACSECDLLLEESSFASMAFDPVDIGSLS